MIDIDPELKQSIDVLDKLLLGRLENENIELLHNEDVSVD